MGSLYLAKIPSLTKLILDRIKASTSGVDFQKYAEQAADQIKTRTRLGYGVDGGDRGGKRYSLKTVKRTEKYERYRQRSKKLNRTVTTPKRHNLSFTGQLLNALYGKAQGSKMYVYLRPERDGKAQNDEIAKYQEKQGRYFFELTDKEVNGLRKDIKQDLLNKFKAK